MASIDCKRYLPFLLLATFYSFINTRYAGDIASVFPYGLENSRGGQDLPCYVEQREGEVIFVPSLWSHLVSTFNSAINYSDII